jgi:23S rRNA (uracil1939-C5)-methyltransferase
VTEAARTPVEVEIHDLARGGAGVGRLPSGIVVFVPYTAPGDRVRVELVEVRKTYAHGKLLEILTPSPVRVNAPCPAFGRCGGCSWQHLPYTLQFETKLKGLSTALRRAGIDPDGIPLDALPASEPYHYRNRIQIRGNPEQKTAGFLESGSHRIVPIDQCTIAEPKLNKALPAFLEEGFRRFNSPFKLELSLTDTGEVRSSWNERHGALGFRQINHAQNVKLREWVADQVGRGDLLLDLYGGDGNLSRPLKGRFKSIVCVDLGAPETGEGTEEGIRFVRKDVRTFFREPDPLGSPTDLSVILDPPREGISEGFASLHSFLSELPLKRLVLVGCDVDSFVRDSLAFSRSGYRLERLGALDLFPQTPHLESLALFSK